MLYVPSALSKVTTRSLLCHERLLSTRVSNVARVSLKRALVSERRFRPNIGRMKFGIFILWFFIFMQRSGEFTFGDNVTFSVIRLSVSLRVAHFLRICPFLSHPSLCMA